MSESHRMQVLMLGWEYPPHISGGLGTACEGLTRALSPLDIDIRFVVPQLYGVESAPHMRLVSPALRTHADHGSAPKTPAGAPIVPSLSGTDSEESAATIESALFEQPDGMFVQTVRIPAALSPYLSPSEYQLLASTLGAAEGEGGQGFHFEPNPSEAEIAALAGAESFGGTGEKSGHYGRNLFGEVLRFADRVTAWARHQKPDVIHAHDWMTFPAATRIARMLSVPLVVHIHSLEQDRSGHGPNPTITAIESAGVRTATRVIAVSHYTARKIHELHGVPFDRISVVHNGVYARPTVSLSLASRLKSVGEGFAFSASRRLSRISLCVSLSSVDSRPNMSLVRTPANPSPFGSNAGGDAKTRSVSSLRHMI